MTGIELVYMFVALGAVGLFLFWVRRSAQRQLGDRRRPSLTEPERERPAAAAPPVAPAPADESDAVPEPPEEGAQAPEAAEAPETAEARAAAELRTGLAKTRGGFVARLGRLFSKKKIGPDLIDDLEEVLLTADIGPRTAERLFSQIKEQLSRSELQESDRIWEELRKHSEEILSLDAPPVDYESARPFVLLTIGVNGVGKTTTIGKLAAMHIARGKRVLLAAGDTFRAAAVEQLEIWGERAGATVVRGRDGADPSSVIFDAIKRATDEKYDLVIADTAGRLHTKVDLMEELKKVRRVANKALDGAPHETWLVVDATTGQNAIAQAKIFKEAMDISGIVLTKLDGTAKGGVILGISDELEVPVRFIGIGERVEDLRPFDPHAFIDALYARDDEVAEEASA